MQLKAFSVLIAVQLILPIGALAQSSAGPAGASGGANSGMGAAASGGGGNVAGGFPGGTATTGAVNSTGFATPLNFNNTGTNGFGGANQTGSFNSGNLVPPNTISSPFGAGIGQNTISPWGQFNGNNLIPSLFRMPGMLGGSVFNSGAQFGALGTGGGFGFGSSGGGGGFFDASGMPISMPGMQVNATMFREGGLLGNALAGIRQRDKGRDAGGVSGNLREYGSKGLVARANARLNARANNRVRADLLAYQPRRAVLGTRGLMESEQSVRGTIIQNSIIEKSCPVGAGPVLYMH
jgi:hypothetical protein